VVLRTRDVDTLELDVINGDGSVLVEVTVTEVVMDELFTSTKLHIKSDELIDRLIA